MYVLTADAIQALDERAEALGVSRELLMESAAREGAEHLRGWLGEIRGTRIAALCGTGGNGGDALGALRWLSLWGADTFAILLGETSGAVHAQEKAYRATCPERLARVTGAHELSLFEGELAEVDLILDGILGVGVRGPARGISKDAIELIRRTRVPVVSVDLPSGLAADTGVIQDPAVRADLTLAMGALKPCHVLPPAADLCGQVELVPVAYPPALWGEATPSAEVITAARCARLLPERPGRGHKGTFGHVLVVGGAVGMAGAIVLAAEGAMRAGAGLVHVVCPGSVYQIVAGAIPDALVHPAPADPDGGLAPQSVAEVIRRAQEADVVLVGPGLGRGEGAVTLIRALCSSDIERLLIDADGLYALAQEPTLLPRGAGKLVLTPHLGEFARLAGAGADEAASDKLAWAREASRRWEGVVVLKGPPTAIGSPEGEVYLTNTGNTALAHGGSGDILAGVIAGLWAGGASAFAASTAAAYVHGLAAELAVAGSCERAVTPTDLLRTLGASFDRIERREASS